MRVRFRRLAVPAAGILAALAVAAPASADPLTDYRNTGAINPCNYSDAELQGALQQLPPDVQQYAPGLTEQLSAGREGCGAGGQPVPGDTRQFEAVPIPGATGGGPTLPPPVAAPRTVIPDPPAPKPAARQRLADITAPAVKAETRAEVPPWVTVVLTALALLGLLIALIRYGGLSTERFTRPIAASFSEAGGRTADAMAELWDTVRMGR